MTEQAGILNKPNLIEECAEAIYRASTSFDGDNIGQHLGQSWMIENSTKTLADEREVVMTVCVDAVNAVLGVLRKRGLIDLQGLELVKREGTK